MKSEKKKIVIGWLYPELMSTYGDRGNILVLKKRCEWRNIDVLIKRLDLGFAVSELSSCDLIFMGGAQDKQQQIVSDDLMKKQKELKRMIDEEMPGLYICGAYQFLGQHYKEADGAIIPGLNILDLYTENPSIDSPRLIGNVIAKIGGMTIVGFENHGGRTYLGEEVKPLGKVIKGFGNNGIDETEGAIYKNSYCTYFHGPILPKNPEFADLLIKLALEKKYHVTIKLSPIDNSLEIQARAAIAKRLNIKL